MRLYDSGESERLQADENRETVRGHSIRIKEVPGNSLKGALDEHELPYAEAFRKKQAQGGTADINLIRQATGNLNYNINTAEIYTDLLETVCDGRRVRIWVYYPRRPYGKKDRAGFLYIHGGSFFAGTPFMCENACRYLAELADCAVFNVDYALAPEHPFPAGLNDCLSAFDCMKENAEKYGVDPEKLCVGGDSAGGLLAAATALEKGRENIKFMSLFYPCVTFEYPRTPFPWDIDDYEICDEERELIEPKLCLGRADGKGDDKLMHGIYSMYLQHGEDCRAPLVSPYNGDFSRLPKTLVVTAEYDGLRYHGECFAAKLEDAGGEAETIRYRGVFHAFMEKLGILPQAEDALRETAKHVKML